MKWRIWKRPPEWKKISLYAVIILVSLFVCEFAFAKKKGKGRHMRERFYYYI